jgi:hypothetical protein
MSPDSSALDALDRYLHEIQRNLSSGNATEHTHRPALKKLIESLASGITATNEPKREECGAPDFVVSLSIGGYQVCEKWLKDRRGRTLTYDDQLHYCKVVTALSETIRLMREIYELIPRWPLP